MSKREIDNSKVMTRKQIARSKREQQQLRMIYTGLGIVGALILLVLGFGLLQTYVLEPGAPVAMVNDTKITTGEYQDRVRYERFGLENQYLQILQQQAMLNQPGNEQLAQFLGPQYQQMASQILQERQNIAVTTVDTLIEDQLVAAEAARRGLTVSDQEVNEYINRFLASQAGGLTASAAQETVTARAEASATAALWTPTPTFTPSPTITATAEITAPTPTPANTPTPAPTPTLKVITETTLSTQYTNWLQTLNTEVGVDEATYRGIVRTLILRDKVQKAIGEETPHEAEQAHARHILVKTEDEAKKVVERLKAGEDFAALAKELSIDTGSGAQGGDLGFVPKGRFVEPVDNAVFSLPLNQVSDPVESQFGWHVIEVLERGAKELSPLDYSRAQRQAYQDWLDKARSEAKIENLWTADKAPAENNFLQQAQQAQQAQQ